MFFWHLADFVIATISPYIKSLESQKDVRCSNRDCQMPFLSGAQKLGKHTNFLPFCHHSLLKYSTSSTNKIDWYVDDIIHLINQQKYKYAEKNSKPVCFPHFVPGWLGISEMATNINSY